MATLPSHEAVIDTETKAYGAEEERTPYSATTTSQEIGSSSETATAKWRDTWAEVKFAFTTREGWIGDYVCIFIPRSFTHGQRKVKNSLGSRTTST